MRDDKGQYVFLPVDPRAEPYFKGLPREIQDGIRAMDHYPDNFQELMDAADRLRETL
ncbi:hypothetical protein [Vermiculatibacterium agrestimuris]|uniref:hypothetical protein n=1 Tax=Vermiculatibacterium agrestimuris TaxID=2941519 RepID=UPI00203F9287|nr:hypothetical protein [Vermiculatibacterium agrestimuris]